MEATYSIILVCISISWNSLTISLPCKLFLRKFLSTFNKSTSTFYLDRINKLILNFIRHKSFRVKSVLMHKLSQPIYSTAVLWCNYKDPSLNHHQVMPSDKPSINLQRPTMEPSIQLLIQPTSHQDIRLVFPCWDLFYYFYYKYAWFWLMHTF